MIVCCYCLNKSVQKNVYNAILYVLKNIFSQKFYFILIRFVESPIFTGRVISSLYQNKDDYSSQLSGEYCVVAEYAKKFGIIDISGTTPPSIRSLKFLIPSLLFANVKSLDSKTKELAISLTPDFLLPMSLMSGGPPSK